jgi:hypothetical protein
VENPVFTGAGLSDVGVPMSSGDGTGPCTRVCVAMLVWVTCPVLKNHSCGYQGSGCLSNRVTRRSYSELTGGEILPACGH